MKKASLLLVLALCLAGIALPAEARQAIKSDNITKITALDLGWVSEIAFQGRYAFTIGEKLTVIDRKTMDVVSTFKCPGDFEGGEIESIKRGYIAVAGGGCGIDSGVFFVDVRDPHEPKIVSTVTGVWSHTTTPFPGKPILYVSPNGLIGDLEGGIEVIIDATNPRKPVVHEYLIGGLGCHDVGFSIREDRSLAACAGGSETQIWDVEDPLAPTLITRFPTPTFFNHSATFSPDGDLLVVGDEAHGVNSCSGTPTGSLWFYDVSNPLVPVLQGSYNIERGSAVSSFWTGGGWCTAHMYNFKPGTRTMATAWYQGGINVLDLEDPSSPTEIAYYLADDFNPWAAYFVGNEIWASDYSTPGGVAVFEAKL